MNDHYRAVHTHKTDNIPGVYALNGNNEDKKKDKLYNLRDSGPEPLREHKKHDARKGRGVIH